MMRRSHMTPERKAKMQAARWAVRESLAERYWAKVDKRGADECWPWLGSKNPAGYGQLWAGADLAAIYGPTIPAHHVATMLAGIDVPDGMVRHLSCLNHACQNPAHIIIVTRAEVEALTRES